MLAGAAVLSLGGMVAHSARALGTDALLGIDTLGPTAVFATIAALWCTRRREFAARMLWRWVWLHLIVGAFITMFLDLSATHIGWHALYGALQIPLILALRARRREASRSRSISFRRRWTSPARPPRRSAKQPRCPSSPTPMP